MPPTAPTSFLLGSVLAVAAGCVPDWEDAFLPPVQVQGRFLSYAVDDGVVVCGSTVPAAEAWMEAVAQRLGINPEEILPTVYYSVDSAVVEEICGSGRAGCARMDHDTINAYGAWPVVFYHELVHAIHMSAWPRRSPLLQEGLASTLDEHALPEYLPPYPAAAIDAAIEATSARDKFARTVGHSLVYFMLTQYGPEAFREFWYATTVPTSAAAFRTTFEEVFGEPLEAMIASTEGMPRCGIPTCVGDPVPWEQGVWTTKSPSSCNEDGVVGFVSEDNYNLARHDLMEITVAGTYDIDVLESDSSIRQGATFISCQDGWCAVSPRSRARSQPRPTLTTGDGRGRDHPPRDERDTIANAINRPATNVNQQPSR